MLEKLPARNGDEVQRMVEAGASRNEIVLACVSKALSIVRTCKAKAPLTREDVTSMAMIALIAIVDRYLKLEERHSDLFGYLYVGLRNELRKQAARDTLIRIPSAVYFEKLAEMELAKLNNQRHDHIINIVPWEDKGEPDNTYKEIDYDEDLHTYTNERERFVIEKRVEQYTIREIATIMCCSTTYVQDTINRVKTNVRLKRQAESDNRRPAKQHSGVCTSERS